MKPELSARPLRPNRLDEKLFVGHRTALEQAERAVDHGLNVLLLAERGMGKTSLLHMLEHRLRGRDTRVVAIPSLLIEEPLELLSLLSYLLERPREVDVAQAARGISESVKRLSQGQLVIAPPGPSNTTQELITALARLRAQLNPDEPAVVLVDELPSGEVAHTLFGRLRDELWELPLVWVVAADRAARGQFLTPPADTFFEVVVELKPLSPQESTSLLRRRLGSEEVKRLAAADSLVGQARGNPRALLDMARRVVLEGVSPREVERATKRRQKAAAELSEPGRRLLAELEAYGPASPSDRAFVGRLGWTPGRAAQVFKELEAAQVVESFSQPGATRPRKVYRPV